MNINIGKITSQAVKSSNQVFALIAITGKKRYQISQVTL